MRSSLMEILCCPRCHAELQVAIVWQNKEEIQEGNITCIKCSRIYPIKDGIVDFIDENELSQDKKDEVIGWRQRRGMKGASKPTDKSLSPTGKSNWSEATRQYLLSLPYVSENVVKDKNDLAYWGIAASCFDICINKIPKLKNARLLDIGAGMGWASRRFAEIGCNVVAMDILTDHMVEANELLRHSGFYFERLVGDYDNLPFFDGSLDIIFSCSSLHHSQYPTRLVRELKRLLKKGGRIVIINEPCRSIFQSEHNLLRDSEEKKLGIGEHVYNYWQYKLPFLINRLRSEVYLEEFHNPDKMEEWLKKKDFIKGWMPLLRFMYRRKQLKKIFQLYWALFKGGCLNIQAQEFF